MRYSWDLDSRLTQEQSRTRTCRRKCDELNDRYKAFELEAEARYRSRDMHRWIKITPLQPQPHEGFIRRAARAARSSAVQQCSQQASIAEDSVAASTAGAHSIQSRFAAWRKRFRSGASNADVQQASADVPSDAGATSSAHSAPAGAPVSDTRAMTRRAWFGGSPAGEQASSAAATISSSDTAAAGTTGVGSGQGQPTAVPGSMRTAAAAHQQTQAQNSADARVQLQTKSGLFAKLAPGAVRKAPQAPITQEARHANPAADTPTEIGTPAVNALAAVRTLPTPPARSHAAAEQRAPKGEVRQAYDSFVGEVFKPLWASRPSRNRQQRPEP